MQMFRSRFFRYGAPFLGLVVLGSFGLKEFSVLRYQFRKSKPLSESEMESMGITLKPVNERTVESIYVKHKKHENIKEWENIRGPRPWEEGSEEVFKEMKDKRIAYRQQNKPSIE